MIHLDRIQWLNHSTKSSIIPLPLKLESVPVVFAFPGATDYCKNKLHII